MNCELENTLVKFGLYVTLVASVFLSACVSAEITTSPVMIKPKNLANAVGLDIYAGDRRRGNPVPRFRGQKTVQIRTNGKTESGGFGEIAGVKCVADAGVYSASFITPANLIVPDYGPSSPALFVRCVTSTASGSVTVNAYNATNAQRQSGAAGAGLLGAIVIGAVAASKRDDNADDFQYPPITVNIK